MPIHKSVMRRRPPKAGTISMGRTVLTKNGDKTRPSKTNRPCFHTTYAELRDQIVATFGGEVFTNPKRSADEPESYDIVIGVDWFDGRIYPSDLYNYLEVWKTAQCVRRCDGINMTMLEGQPVRGTQPCLCLPEMENGAKRLCKPTTKISVDVAGLPVVMPWSLQTSGWDSSQRIVGIVEQLEARGVTSGRVPVRVSAVDGESRDDQGRVQKHKAFEIVCTLTEVELTAVARPVLTNDTAAALPGDDDREVIKASVLAIIGQLDDTQKDEAKALWQEMVGTGVGFSSADIDDLRDYHELVRPMVDRPELPAGVDPDTGEILSPQSELRS